MASRFDEYLGAELEALLARLAGVAATLADLGAEIAQARSDEVGAKASGWNSTVETGVTARDRAARFSATPATQTVFELEGMRAGLCEERDFLRLLIDVRVRTKELAHA